MPHSVKLPGLPQFRHQLLLWDKSLIPISTLFQEETVRDTDSGQLYGLEKFWAFIKYYRHATELHVMPKLKAMLEPFKTIEDFKILYTVMQAYSVVNLVKNLFS